MEERFDGFKKSGVDAAVENLLREHCRRHNIDPIDAVKHFPVLARRQWLKRFLAHTQLFQMTLDVPGDIAELGVFRGLGLFTWANLLEAFCIGDRTKTVYGFDNWEGFVGLAPEDGKPIEQANKVEGGFSPAAFKDELIEAIRIFDEDRFVPWKPRIRLVEGSIEETAQAFVNENPGVRFSLIHFDCDLYRPTRAALEAFYPVLSRGGVVIFDEYSIPDWPGETKAVDEFLQLHQEIRLNKFSWTNAPAAYFVKP